MHISALSNTFVKDPHSVVKAGQIVKLKVLEVGEKRKRIALTMRMNDALGQAQKSQGAPRDARAKSMGVKPNRDQASMGGAMAAALAKLKG